MASFLIYLNGLRKVNSLILLVLIFCTSCGKGLNILGDDDGDVDPLKPGNARDQIVQSVKVYCEDETDCNTAIANVISFKDANDKNPSSCTGFLISSNVIATSKRCIPESRRFSQARCDGFMYFKFPGTFFKSEKTVGCKQILAASDVIEAEDPALLDNELAFIELAESVNRDTLSFSSQGIEGTKHYYMWRVRRESSTAHFIQEEKCIPVFESYANPYADNKFDANIPLAQCTFSEEAHGAPIVNSQGNISGAVLKQLPISFKQFFLNNDLIFSGRGRKSEISPMIYVFNMACAVSIGSDKAIPSECYNRPTFAQLNHKRHTMLNSLEIHQSKMDEIKEEFLVNESANEYLNWDINFEQVDGINKHQVRITPLCFTEYDDWSYRVRRRKEYDQEFYARTGSIRIMFDSFLIPHSIPSFRDNKFFVTFYPKKLKKDGRSNVKIYNETVANNLKECSSF